MTAWPVKRCLCFSSLVRYNVVREVCRRHIICVSYNFRFILFQICVCAGLIRVSRDRYKKGSLCRVLEVVLIVEDVRRISNLFQQFSPSFFEGLPCQ